MSIPILDIPDERPAVSRPHINTNFQNLKTAVESLQTGIVRTIRPATSISNAFNPTSYSFVERGVYRPNKLIDPDFVAGEVIFNADPVGFLNGVIGTLGVGYNLNNGYLNLPGTNNGGDAFVALDQAVCFEAPCFAIELEIPKFGLTGSPAQSILTLGLFVGSSNVGLQLRWDIVNSKIGIYTTNSAGDPTTLGESSFTPPTVPFAIAITYSARSVTAQVRLEGGNYFTVGRGVVAANGAYDLRVPSVLNSYNRISIQSVQYQNTGALSLGNMRWGYLGGINGLADKMVKFADGTPVQHGNFQFLINSMQHIAASSDEGAPSATFTIQKVDPTRRFVKTVAMVFVVRTVGGVDHIEGENSGACFYDIENDEFVYLIPNWGDYRSASAFGPVHTYVYRRKGFPTGVVILRGGQVFSGLPTSTSDYDPDIYDDGTLIHMVYSRTSATTNWDSYSTVHVTTPRATFGPGAIWTQVAIQALGGASEGPKFHQAGGNHYILCTDNTNHLQKVFDFSLNQLGTFSAPAGTPAGIAHACMVNYRDGANDRMFWLYFDNAKYDNFTNTWGAIHFLEHTAQQVGHDFSQRLLADIDC